MKRTDLLLRAAFAIFLVAIIVSSVAISVLAVGNNSYTPPFVSDKTEIFGGDVLKDKLSIAISDAEMAYLRERGDFVISYPAGVSSAYVLRNQRQYHGEAGIILSLSDNSPLFEY